MMIELYEDNAGHLFLSDGTTVYAGLENVDSTFVDDARCLLEGDTDNWNLDTYPTSILPYYPIATYDAESGAKVVRLSWGAPAAGMAGRRYLGITD